MIKLYGIKNCDTVKKAMTFLEKNNVDFEFVDFKKNPPGRSDIEKWMKVFKDFPVNKKGTTFKKYQTEYEALKEEEKFSFIIKNNSMIKRPILESNGKVVSIGFDEEKFKEVL